MKLFLRVLISLSLLFIIIGLSSLWAVNFLNGPGGLNGQKELIYTIEKGATLNNIAVSLEKVGAVKFSWSLKLYSMFLGTEADFKAGLFRIEQDMSLKEIHDLLVEGRQQLFRITIPEGWTSRQIADFLGEMDITDSVEFREIVSSGSVLEEFGLTGKSLEGFLYPDTYLFQKNFPAKKIIHVMVSNFFSRLTEIYPEYKTLSGSELFDKVILASIVEKEYRDPSEAPLMAGVFYNRLEMEKQIPLGSCATIVYIISDIQEKPHPDIITFQDLEIDSPYNTYINRGLPPGPISNPGEVALIASFYPKKSDYLYFLLKNKESGQHEFTKNLSEHNAAYNMYIKKN